MQRFSWFSSAAAFGLFGAIAGIAASGLATAQDAPESILPPGFDDPAPAPTPTPVPTALPTAAPATPTAPVVAPPSGSAIPGALPAPGPLPPVPTLSGEELQGLPSLEELENLSVDELDERLGLKPKFDIPPAARRSLSRVGVLAPSEGGMPTGSLAKQPERLVRAVLSGTNRPLVSRWGHILLRRALASRLTAPEGMNPIEFAALRAGVLNSLGEYAVARALAQDVDTGNWSTALTSQALTAYIALSDLVGACPAVRLQGSSREDPQWMMLQAICNAYAGESALAGSQLNRALSEEIAPAIDVLLAQRYAGAAGRGRRAVEIEWEGVEAISPWRFAIANAVGEPIPQSLMGAALQGDDAKYYNRAGALASMLPLQTRLAYAEHAAQEGILSSRSMVDLYSQIYADNAIGGDAGDRAALLREAYVGADTRVRVAAMRELWGEAGTPSYGASVTTAYAAARIVPNADDAGFADGLIASMLAAGLDQDAMSWGPIVAEGSLAWGLIAAGGRSGDIATLSGVDGFISGDDSEDQRKSAFLVAGLGGLGRIGAGDLGNLDAQLDLGLDRQTRWSRMIDRAAEVNNPTLVVLLAGLGMQGESWAQMTPLHLYHVTSALRRVGLEAEARMIAAEAISRG